MRENEEEKTNSQCPFFFKFYYYYSFEGSAGGPSRYYATLGLTIYNLFFFFLL